jgi:WD40 repeat protein
VSVADLCSSAATAPCKVDAAAFSPDYSKVLLAQRGGDVLVASVAIGTVLLRLPPNAGKFMGAHDPVSCLAESPDGSKILWGTTYGGYHTHAMHLWSASGTELRELGGGNTGVVQCGFSPDGSKLIEISEDSGVRNVRVWQVDTGEQVYAAVNAAALSYSQDGTKLLVQIRERKSGDQLQLIEAGSGRLLSSFKPTPGIRCFELSPDGSSIIAGSDSGSAFIWDTSGKLLHELRGHIGPIAAVSFFHSGSMVLTAGEDHTIRIWQAGNGELIDTLEGFQDSVGRVSLSRDDSRLAASTDNYRIWSWNLKTRQGAELR